MIYLWGRKLLDKQMGASGLKPLAPYEFVLTAQRRHRASTNDKHRFPPHAPSFKNLKKRIGCFRYDNILSFFHSVGQEPHVAYRGAQAEHLRPKSDP